MIEVSVYQAHFCSLALVSTLSATSTNKGGVSRSQGGNTGVCQGGKEKNNMVVAIEIAKAEGITTKVAIRRTTTIIGRMIQLLGL